MSPYNYNSSGNSNVFFMYGSNNPGGQRKSKSKIKEILTKYIIGSKTLNEN